MEQRKEEKCTRLIFLAGVHSHCNQYLQKGASLAQPGAQFVAPTSLFALPVHRSVVPDDKFQLWELNLYR